ncbi:vitamin B12 ABC transporter ATP-binding protein BtuD [Cedecea davisae]|uniref:Vitamin B12 import ATP-binding protein BtuD n=1 Tax=Cedecea davisae TaxID=158484 RepID=A0ABS6DJJ1_9ENTR|nr:vitamin B12 ABC transporter ATP-binding protein BtuD [Cedecea davisae]MBU4683389.1 vitamin B12 ABC transporter ATP-binding protein BtuD [Cedecea davisae]MBU4685139.1 vitamin B12 ABC transporter ATP-binding protein BtuD [Cedecea davisae]
MPLLQLNGVTVADRLGPITATVEPGELIHLVGPNGAGKSTLLARMAGLSDGQGSIQLNDRPLDTWLPAALSRRRAWLSQQQLPPFSMPVWHYLQLHQPSPDAEQAMMRLAEDLWLKDKLTRPVSQLSGGEWQRVRLAAVLLQIDPEANPLGQLLLLDEPMNSLDVAQQAALDRVLLAFCEAGIAVVMSGHDLNHSLRHAHKVWLLREGKMVAQGGRDLVLTPQNLAAAYQMPFRLLSIEGHSMLISPL